MLKNQTVDPINYYYCCTAVILLLICYYFLQSTKHTLHVKELDKSNIQNKTITVQTKNGEAKMDPNVFEIHLKKMKDDIIELNTNCSFSDCDDIKKYLDKTKTDTQSYINVNVNDVNPEFCDITSKLALTDDHVLQERELLKKKLTNSTESDSVADNTSDRIRYSILELLIDIDIILFLVRSSLCKTGKLDLSNIDSLILELYKNKCVENPSKKLSSDNNVDDDSSNVNMDMSLENTEGLVSDKINVSHVGKVANRLSGSQIMKDGFSVFYENKLLTHANKPTDTNQKMTIDNNLLMSHERQPEFIENIGKSGSKFISQSSKLNNELDHRSTIRYKPHVDYDSRTCLGGP
jgi:hypothetical protein